MPLTKKGSHIMEAMQEQYGAKKGESVFYASANKGTINGVEPPKKDKRRAAKTKRKMPKRAGMAAMKPSW